MRYLTLFGILITVIWSACSKPDAPDSGFNTPVFSAAFEDSTFDTTSFAVTAGLNGYYLFTRIEPDSDGPTPVLVMSGAFADASCPDGNCPGSLKFEFRNEWLENFVRPDSIFVVDYSLEYKSPQSDSLALNTVAIQWITPQGKILRTDIGPQPQDTFGNTTSHFIILDSEPWETNERGETTWKMKVKFSCRLFDLLQEPAHQILGSGVIAVSYK